MNFKERVKMHLAINEEMADKTAADLSVMVKTLTPIWKRGTVLKINDSAAKLKELADDLRTNNAYRNLTARADQLRKEMMEYTSQK